VKADPEVPPPSIAQLVHEFGSVIENLRILLQHTEFEESFIIESMKLPIDRFRNVVRDSVLVSLDLLIVNDKAEVLVGRRQNPPAKDWLFVPGGRVYKEERLTDALQRISVSETGVDLSQAGGSLYGVYDHLYTDNGLGEDGISTHYAVIACLFENCPSIHSPGDAQHEYFQLMSIPELLSHPRVHAYTRNYFVADAPNLFLGGARPALSPRSF
jgi:colanic acid biosynthesis protein WcaH